MTLVVIALGMAGLGLIDLLLPEKGSRRRRAAISSVVTLIMSLVLLALREFELQKLLVHAGVYLGLFTTYAQLNRSEASTGWKGAVVLAGYFLLTAAALLTPGSPPTAETWLNALIGESRLGRALSIGADQLVLLVACVLLLCATSNHVVRVILKRTGAELQTDREQLRGGRWIGPLERLLIFGFAAASDLTGAALIASAKSLLRFPEISKGAGTGESIHKLTEYFLVGSLSSWSIALYLAMLFKVAAQVVD